MKIKILVSGIFCLMKLFSAAQPFTMNPDIVPTELNLHNFNPEGKNHLAGRMNVTEVTQDKDTLYFFAKGFSIYSAGYVGITLENKENDLEVGLFTENWLKPVQAGNTADTGHWERRFKTEGDFGIRVIAKSKPAKYSIVVWNGKDVEVDVPSVFSYKEDGPGNGGGEFFKKNLLYIIIGLLMVIIIFILLKRRKR